MTWRRNLTGAAVVAVALAGLGYLASRQPGTAEGGDAADADPPPASTGRVASCQLLAGAHGAYRFESKAEAVGDGPSPKDSVRTLFSWVVTRTGPAATLRGVFTSTELSQEISEPAQRVRVLPAGSFELELGADCRVSHERYPKEWPATTRQLVSTVLHTFELAIGPGTTWELEQKDSLGTYVARYQATVAPAGVALTKRKRRYLVEHGAFGGFELRVQVVNAETIGAFSPKTPWLEGASGHEHVRVESKGRRLGDLQQTFSLVREDAAYFAPPPLAPDLDGTDPFTVDVKAEAVVDPGIAALSQAQALARFAAILGATKAGDSYNAALFLAEWLRAHPEAAAVLLGQIRSGVVKEAERPAMFLAFERAGTPESRRALADALADNRMTEMDRARAASALSDVPSPGPEVTKALTAAATAPGGPRLVAGTSLRALGHYEERLESIDPTQRAEVRQTLRDALRTAPDDSRRVDSVDAIGNSGDGDFVQELKAELASSSVVLREHAAHAFRRMPVEVASEPLLARLPVEPEASVRVAIVETLTALGARGDDALAVGLTLLPTEKTPAVRGAIIKWLGTARDRPAVKAGLAAWFPKEPAPELQQLVGRYLPVETLPP